MGLQSRFARPLSLAPPLNRDANDVQPCFHSRRCACSTAAEGGASSPGWLANWRSARVAGRTRPDRRRDPRPADRSAPRWSSMSRAPASRRRSGRGGRRRSSAACWPAIRGPAAGGAGADLAGAAGGHDRDAGRFSLAVCDPDPGAPVTQLAREHFGALTPLRAYPQRRPGAGRGQPGCGRSPCCRYPSARPMPGGWRCCTRTAAAHHRPPAVLEAPAGRVPAAQALVVASTPPDPSDERSVPAGLGMRPRCQPGPLDERTGGGRTAAGDDGAGAPAGVVGRQRAGRGRRRS